MLHGAPGHAQPNVTDVTPPTSHSSGGRSRSSRRRSQRRAQRRGRSYKILIAGAGLSGLFMAFLLHRAPELNGHPTHITLLDKSGHLGGRVVSVRTSHNRFYDAGCTRISSAHARVLQLVSDLQLTLVPLAKANASRQKKLRRQFTELEAQFVERHGRDALRECSFAHVMREGCTRDLDSLMSAFSLRSALVEMNAADFLATCDRDYFASAYSTVARGLQSITDALQERLSERAENGVTVAVQRSCELRSVVRARTGSAHRSQSLWASWHDMSPLDTSGGAEEPATVVSRRFDAVFLAMPAQCVAQLDGIPREPPCAPLWNTVSRNRYLRVFAQYDTPPAASSFTIATPTLGIITSTGDPQWVQVSYTDHTRADAWQQTLLSEDGETRLRDALRAESVRLHKTKTSELLAALSDFRRIDLRYWKAGTHSWQPSHPSATHYERALHPDAKQPLFVIGSSLSHAQHWMEGALETAFGALERWKRYRREWQPRTRERACSRKRSSEQEQPLFVIGSPLSHAQHWMEGALETAFGALGYRREWPPRTRERARSRRRSSEQEPLPPPPPPPPPPHGCDAETTFTMEEVKQNQYVVLDDYVYDVREFVPRHPGGAKVLKPHLGKNISRLFRVVGHSANARSIAEKYCVGRLAPD